MGGDLVAGRSGSFLSLLGNIIQGVKTFDGG